MVWAAQNDFAGAAGALRALGTFAGLRDGLEHLHGGQHVVRVENALVCSDDLFEGGLVKNCEETAADVRAGLGHDLDLGSTVLIVDDEEGGGLVVADVAEVAEGGSGGAGWGEPAIEAEQVALLYAKADGDMADREGGDEDEAAGEMSIEGVLGVGGVFNVGEGYGASEGRTEVKRGGEDRERGLVGREDEVCNPGLSTDAEKVGELYFKVL